MDDDARIEKIRLDKWTLERLKRTFTKAYLASEGNCPVRMPAIAKWRRALLMQLRTGGELRRRGWIPQRVTTIEFRRKP